MTECPPPRPAPAELLSARRPAMRRAFLGFGLALLAASCGANVVLLQPEQSKWRFWAAVYAFLTHVVEWADTAEREGWSDYVASSRARDILDDSRRRLRQAQVRLPAGTPARGVEFLGDFKRLVHEVGCWVREGLYGSA